MSFQLKGRFVFFGTNNVSKFDEARRALAEFGVAVGMLRVKSLEVQSDDLEVIAGASVSDAFEKCRLPIVVEDAGFFVEALNGFPGPYAAYVYGTVGNLGLLRLMEGVGVRRARFVSVVAYLSAELGSPVCFRGVVDGEIVGEERRAGGRFGFGFDPVFKPAGSDKTFAEMDVEEKNHYSHRAEAFRKFGEWYKSV